MKIFAITAAFIGALTLPVSAQEQAAPETAPAPSPNEIVSAASPEEWVTIAPEDLLVMTLAPDAAGNSREVILQLMPAPFSQGWVENIRTLARAQWYDGITVNRVQDNYVVQWGDPGHDNPESGEVETKALPEGLRVMGEEEYTPTAPEQIAAADMALFLAVYGVAAGLSETLEQFAETGDEAVFDDSASLFANFKLQDSHTDIVGHNRGWPYASDLTNVWPIHCYGMVGVGRNYSPDTGSGAELYTVIGHAPRHLDRNIALVGRIISGMEHLSSLPRGSGALGFYTEEEADKRTPILSVRAASDLPEGEQPQYEYLTTEGEAFAAYAEARANRRDPFFIVPAGGADICNIPVPVRAIEIAD